MSNTCGGVTKIRTLPHVGLEQLGLANSMSTWKNACFKRFGKNVANFRPTNSSWLDWLSAATAPILLA